MTHRQDDLGRPPGATHRSLEHESHQHFPGLLVLHEGIAHRIVALEGPDRASHEFRIEPGPHIPRIVVAQQVRPDIVAENVLVDGLEPDVVFLREFRAMPGVERLDDFGQGLGFFLRERIGAEPVDGAQGCVVVLAKAGVLGIALLLQALGGHIQHVIRDVLALRCLPGRQDPFQPAAVNMELFQVSVAELDHLCDEGIEPQEGSENLTELLLFVLIQVLVEPRHRLADDPLENRPLIRASLPPGNG